jgi:hypothetical protein
MDPATSARKKKKKKFVVKSLLWNRPAFVMKPQEGMGNPFAPLRRGPDGLLLYL